VNILDKVENKIDLMNQECKELLISKNKDYSSDNLIMVGPPGIASRLVDKVHRLYNLSSNSNLLNHETIKDTLMDIQNYTHLYAIESDKLLRPKYIMVYLAGPIDDVDIQDAKGWRDLMARQLWTKGISVFNPATAYNLNLDRNTEFISKRLININKKAIEECDLLVANLSGKGRGFGTIREIEYAKSIGKEVIIIGELESLSAFDCLVFKSVLDFYSYLNIRIGAEKVPAPVVKKKND